MKVKESTPSINGDGGEWIKGGLVDEAGTLSSWTHSIKNRERLWKVNECRAGYDHTQIAYRRKAGSQSYCNIFMVDRGSMDEEPEELEELAEA
ncbi:MAG: hypothetical protein ACOX4J_03510 [Anaerovoracaceae bacterium]